MVVHLTPTTANGELANAVEFRRVSKHFADHGHEAVAAVNGVNLEVYEGEFFSLLGPSGVGSPGTELEFAL